MEFLNGEKYILFTTFRSDGTAVPTPVWFIELDDHTLGFWTSSTSGKARRLAHTPRVTLQPCDSRGNPRPGSTLVQATARLTDAAQLDNIRAHIRAKYRTSATLLLTLARLGGVIRRRPSHYADRGVVISLT